jgi:hypothetical protein
MPCPQDDDLPFWNVNVPPHLQTVECPAYLTYALANPKDRQILSTPDSAYQRQSWPEVKQIIRSNRLEKFLRVPSDLRRYREYCAHLTSEWGSIMAFVKTQRLGWTDGTASGSGPFEDPGT